MNIENLSDSEWFDVLCEYLKQLKEEEESEPSIAMYNFDVMRKSNEIYAKLQDIANNSDGEITISREINKLFGTCNISIAFQYGITLTDFDLVQSIVKDITVAEIAIIEDKLTVELTLNGIIEKEFIKN